MTPVHQRHALVRPGHLGAILARDFEGKASVHDTEAPALGPPVERAGRREHHQPARPNGSTLSTVSQVVDVARITARRRRARRGAWATGSAARLIFELPGYSNASGGAR